MIDKRDDEQELRLLIDKPSVAGWRKEILAVVEGARSSRESRVGEANDYVETLLSYSVDQASARETFQVALESVVREWDPTLQVAPEHLENLFALMAEYHPPSGVEKLSKYTESCDCLRRSTSHHDVAHRDVHLKALSVLDTYFPVATRTGNEGPGFDSYIDLLCHHLRNPDYRFDATKRLLTRGLLDKSVVSSREESENYNEKMNELLKTRRSASKRSL